MFYCKVKREKGATVHGLFYSWALNCFSSDWERTFFFCVVYQGKFIKDSNKFRRLFLHPASSPLYRLQRPWNLKLRYTMMNGISLWLALNSYKVLDSWKSLEICPEIFYAWKKSGKMVKRRKFFFVFKVTTSALEVKFFSFCSNLGLSCPYVCSA